MLNYILAGDDRVVGLGMGAPESYRRQMCVPHPIALRNAMGPILSARSKSDSQTRNSATCSLQSPRRGGESNHRPCQRIRNRPKGSPAWTQPSPPRPPMRGVIMMGQLNLRLQARAARGASSRKLLSSCTTKRSSWSVPAGLCYQGRPALSSCLLPLPRQRRQHLPRFLNDALDNLRRRHDLSNQPYALAGVVRH
jgi:hypothetical protein